jgi:alginate O-acetyltransferase complex protein AlgI
MNFVQFEFPIFFLFVLVVYWLLKKRTWQNVLLAICSAIFYGWVHPWFLILLYSSAVLDFHLGQLIHDKPEHKKRFLILSLLGNLGMLGYFKYCNFFIDNFNVVLQTIGLSGPVNNLDIFLPVGISFYTFQTMSYTLDIYLGKLQPRRRFLDYVVFISFFPQLVAGPVERAATLLPQMEQERKFSWENMRSGFQLALWGAFKKVCIADVISMYVDRIYNLQDPSGPMIWAATLGFTIQILADFSGYTDIARGTARMLGIKLMLNFDHPYIATNPSQFWRRWHISFSTWIRDYLYIPLGGSGRNSKNPELIRLRSSYGAMLLSGLWHGASWTFVIWGAYHATLLTCYRHIGKRIPKALKQSAVATPFAVVLMFFLTVVGWMIFRETDISHLVALLQLSPFSATDEQWIAASVMFGLVLFCTVPLIIALVIEKLVVPKIQNQSFFLPMQTTLWAVLIVCILILRRDVSADFIYFQF